MADAASGAGEAGGEQEDLARSYARLEERCRFLEDQLNRRLSFSSVVAGVLARFARVEGAGLQESIETALREMAQASRLEHAYLVLLDEGDLSFSMAYEWCAQGVQPQAAAMQRVDLSQYPWMANLLLSGQIVMVARPENFVSEAWNEKASSEAYGSRSILIVPLREQGGKVRGGLGLETLSSEYDWDEEDIRQLTVVGDVLANVLVRADVEAKLRASEVKLHAITELSPDIISVLDENGTLIFNSAAAKRIHGYEASELVGRSTMDLWHPDDAPAVIETFQRLLAHPSESAKVQYRYKNKDGSWVWMEAVASNQLNNPDISGIITLSRDVSDRKREEEERRQLDLKLQQIQKLESLGTLAGGVAHDFNNLLVAILGNLELALAVLPKDASVRDGLGMAWKASQRAANLSRQMLAYAGKASLSPEPTDLNALVIEMADMLEVSISKKARLEIRSGQGLPTVIADAAQLRQVIMNLILNAAEAMGDPSGTILISTWVAEFTKEELSKTWLDDHLPGGWYLGLEVADTGYGMDAQTLSKIFDPFFSTKFTGRGLGLASVLGIVRGHRGAIRVRSQLGQGTDFCILLPASESVPKKESVPDPSPLPQGSGKLLLVDDEDIVRDVGSTMLGFLGYEVESASGGRKALALLEQDLADKRSIRLVILDLTMPDMDGRETLRLIRKMCPELPVVIASGYDATEVSKKFENDTNTKFIQKPFALDDLGLMIAQALGNENKSAT